MDKEKVIKGLECCSVPEGYCVKCPYETDGYVAECTSALARDALALIKEQGSIIEQYHKADGFLDVHGWKWESR